MIITPDTLIGDIIEGDVNIEAVANVLTSVGMHCLGCAIAHGETVGEAAEVHNVDVNELIARLNEAAKIMAESKDIKDRLYELRTFSDISTAEMAENSA